MTVHTETVHTETVHADTRAYEAWLESRGEVIAADLELKHREMSAGLFPFLRATFYRWCRLWPAACPELTGAPPLLAVGDLHVENFGTWRDVEGRLVWGVNDADEAQLMPYALDLVRLATSALIALEERSPMAADVAEAILEGYRDGLKSGCRPFVLEEDHGWLRELALGEMRDPKRFWEKLQGFKAEEPKPEVRSLLLARLPAGSSLDKICHRVAGLGSLGRLRSVALATLRGAAIAREIKALYPSAWSWVEGKGDAPIRCGDLAAGFGCPDPFLAFDLAADRRSGWVTRRLAPQCCRVELADLPHRREDRHLLRAMGRETANIHLGSVHALDAVTADLKSRPPHWLRDAAEAMAKATRADWKAWRE